MSDIPLIQRTCKTCKWWKKPRDPWGSGTCRECAHPGHEQHHTRKAWVFIRVAERGRQEIHPGPRTRTALHTGPDFGCIHHEPKEPTA